MGDDSVSQLMAVAYREFAQIHPRDRVDARFYVNEVTRALLGQEHNFEPHDLTQLLGIPLEIDENLPDGVVLCLAETELDRVIRRATEQGRYISIVKPVPALPRVLPAPPPTIKALLRHWWKKVTR
jgi:hypothetical protein